MVWFDDDIHAETRTLRTGRAEGPQTRPIVTGSKNA